MFMFTLTRNQEFNRAKPEAVVDQDMVMPSEGLPTMQRLSTGTTGANGGRSTIPQPYEDSRGSTGMFSRAQAHE